MAQYQLQIAALQTARDATQRLLGYAVRGGESRFNVHPASGHTEGNQVDVDRGHFELTPQSYPGAS